MSTKVYKAKDENLDYEKELTAQLTKLQKTRQKYMDMYADDLISRDELNAKIGGMRKEIERLENELKMISYNLTKAISSSSSTVTALGQLSAPRPL